MAFIAAALAVVILDQLTKWLVQSNMFPGETLVDFGIVRLIYVTNTGGAFGLLANQTFLLIFTAAIGVGAILLYYRYPIFEGPLIKLALGLQLGGAIGNLADRLRFGHVTDFIDFKFWPVFNVADSSIVVGVCILAYYLLFKTRETEVGKVKQTGQRSHPR